MTQAKTIGFVFIDGYADWEWGLLSASAVEWFGARAVALSPDGGPVHGIGGFALSPERAADPAVNRDLDGVAVIGSDGWATAGAPDVSGLLADIEARGGVLGGICAGTLPLARAGLLAGRSHTSNGREWIGMHVPGYPGVEAYQDVPRAVRDGRLVTAPGSAPGTFAIAFLEALYPERGEQLTEMAALFAREYDLAPARSS
jgi:putative intracellular protease/amidase